MADFEANTRPAVGMMLNPIMRDEKRRHECTGGQKGRYLLVTTAFPGGR